MVQVVKFHISASNHFLTLGPFYPMKAATGFDSVLYLGKCKWKKCACPHIKSMNGEDNSKVVCVPLINVLRS